MYLKKRQTLRCTKKIEKLNQKKFLTEYLNKLLVMAETEHRKKEIP